MDIQSIPPKRSGINIDEDLFQSSTIHKNISQNIVVTTEDKIRLCLIKYKESLDAHKEWVAPASVLIALITTLIAADFKQFLSLSSEVWKSLFIFGSILCGYLLIRAWKKSSKYKGNNIESIIEDLKQGS